MRKNNKSGLIIIDKPAGMTSAAVVSKIKKSLNIQKAGHLGTLDPMATGVLCIALNNATRLIQYIQDGFKEYYAVIKLGEETDTLDADGIVTKTASINKVDIDIVNSAVNLFKGRISQTPPMYSAACARREARRTLQDQKVLDQARRRQT